MQQQEMCHKNKSDHILHLVYDKEGSHPDPSNVECISYMPIPTKTTEVQKFLRMVTYLAPFVPNLSTLTADLRNLLKKDVRFMWTESHVH